MKRPLFVLRNIALANFYLYAQDFPISSLGNTVFLGGNGSGKSMLLDAIQIVMTGMNGKYLDLNSRVSEGGRNTRTIREACLGLLDDGEGFERQACLTYIALGFESADGKKKCTAGVCLEAKVAVDEENVLGLFVAEDVILKFSDFVNPAGKGFEEKNWHSFLEEQRRKGATIHTFSRQNNRSFLRHLYAIINSNSRGTQLDPDRARAALRQALSFDIQQIKSVTEFVKKFLLDEAPIEIDVFQARYATWRGLRKEIARVEAEIQQVEAIRAQCERVMDDQFNARFWIYGRERADYDRHTGIVARQRQEVAVMQAELDSVESYKITLSDSLTSLRLRLEAITRQIDGTPAYEEIKQAQAEKERQEAVRRAGSIEAKVIFDALSAMKEVGGQDTLPLQEFPQAQEFLGSLRPFPPLSAHSIGWPEAPRAIADIISEIPALDDLRARADTLYQDASVTKARLFKEHEEVERQLRNLRSGGTYMSPDTQAFLDDMAKIDVPARTLSEVADITPRLAEWRGIVEAILGDWCDAVIVEPRYMDQAYGHFDRNYKSSRTKLVQSENTSSHDREAGSGSLAEAVTTDNPYARAFLNVRLGRIRRAQAAREIRTGDLAASVDGKYAHGRGIEYRKLPSIPRLGRSIRDQQIMQLTSEEERLRADLQKVRNREARLYAVVEALKRAHTVLVAGKANALAVLRALAEADQGIAHQSDVIDQLESTLPQGLLEEKRKIEEERKRYLEQQKEEVDKERDLRDKIGRRSEAMEANALARNNAGKQALEFVPCYERRRRRHEPAIGLELFMTRARAAYRKELTYRSHPAEVRNHFDALAKSRKQSQQTTAFKLMSSIQDYVLANPDQHPGIEWGRALENEETSKLFDWISLRHRHLTEAILRSFKEQVDKAVLALVETMVHDFLSRLRANIDFVERVKDDLNRALRGSIFMGEIYQIRQERDQDKETIRYLIDRLDIVAPKATALMQRDADANDPDQVKIRELIDMLTLEGGDEAAHKRQLREIADYRSYFRFSIDICDPDNNGQRISDLEQRRGKASGGQKFVPFYICLGVAAASAYHNHLGDAKDVPPQSALLLMDEAFEKLDPENIYKIIDFYKSLGLQLIMAAPKTHQALYQETFNTLISIVRSGRAIRATAQHFHPAAHQLLHDENPMHKPRDYFEELARRDRENAAQ